MSEIKTNEVLDILDKLQFFQGQRAGRELWLDKSPVVQEQDLYNFNCDINKIRSYIQSKNNMMQEIVERLEEDSKHWNKKKKEALKNRELEEANRYDAFEIADNHLINFIKEVGGLDERD